MKTAKLCLLASLAFNCTLPLVAEKPETTSIPVAPIGSATTWFDPEDYPAAAMRYNMTGTTAFRLIVDATGKAVRCDIVESSGFDVLDTTTCQRAMAKSHFPPPRDRTGKSIEGVFESRVRWVMPDGAARPVTESFGSMFLSIDQTGKVTSCRMTIHIPAANSAPNEKSCGQIMGMPPLALGMEFRGDYQGSSAEIEIQQADVFTPDLRARVLAPMPGYEQRGLNIYHFTVTKDGKLGQCDYEEQRGSELFAADYCGTVRDSNFDPPFSAFSKDGSASGWHIVRVMLKTGK